MKKRSPSLPEPDGLDWTELLTAELAQRFELLAREMGSNHANPVLKGMVVTDDEIGGILARAGAPRSPAFAPGSLMGQLMHDAPLSSAHLHALQTRFGLNGFEIDCLLVALSAEISPSFERVFAYLNDAISAKLPGADILLRTVAPGELSHKALLGPDGRLQRYGLLVAADSGRYGPFRVAEGVLRYALRQEGCDPLLARAWHDADVPPLAPVLWSSRSDDIEQLKALLDAGSADAHHDPRPLVVSLRARAGSGRQYLTQIACQQLGVGCISLDARKLKGSDDAQRTLTAAMRDALLLGAAVFVHHADVWLDDAQQLGELRAHLQFLVRELGWALILASEADLGLPAWFPAARVADVAWAAPSAPLRTDAWCALLPQLRGILPEWHAPLAAALGAKFRLTQGEIALACQRTRNAAEHPFTEAGWSDLLHRVAGSVATPRLSSLAQALPVRHTLADLVLPADRLAALHDVVRRVRHRTQVLERWGLDAVSSGGRGLVALFHGASGTGKSMAAESIAGELRMQLFRIDLAGVVSKYIGETEKNLRAVFEEADRADAVLFFDEADALFGKRSDVKDAHDRYANIEINYLLQRIEQFEGIAVLATNMRAHLDDAFVRRIHITVEFPLPREAERLGLWDRSFPDSAPLAGDIDWPFLAQRFELTGGAIRNAALGAAFLAADHDGVIGMPQIVNALRAELVKAGKRVSDSDFGAYACHLQAHAATPRRARARSASQRIPELSASPSA